ncbi:MAG: rhomboid family intramembrane serine protease [Candidatus Aenigmatarchaeota archaeon]
MRFLEDFPVVTFILATTYLVVYLFTYSNLPFYEMLFGFIPKHPQIYTLITYTFIHADISHLLGNMIVLIIAGLAIEQTLGKFAFFSIYLASGNVAVVFDIIGRLLLGISFNLPFIGGSGAIFGLIAVAAMIKPMEKIPTLLMILTFSAFLGFFTAVPNLPSPLFLLIIGTLVAMGLVFIIPLLPSSLPLGLALPLFMFNWLASFLIQMPTPVSNIGHLGGVLGGILAFVLFAKK